MHIVWFSWKDINHPEAGGAEAVSDQIRKRLVKDGHSVTLITAKYPDSKHEEVVDGVKVIRTGGRYTVYVRAKSAYRIIGSDADIIIDEMNTIPFTPFRYTKNIPVVLLTYQLARSVWFYQLLLPLSLIGYLVEPIYLKVMSKKYETIITESNSTKNDLIKFGFIADRIKVFRVGITTLRPISLPSKKSNNNVLFLGSLRPMKRPIDAIKAFEFARDAQPNLRLVIAGGGKGPYANKVTKYAKQSRHSAAIELKGRVEEAEKRILLEESGVILVTSIKEGWGLIVTEANCHGTPAIVYDTDGLRDSVQDDITGKIVSNGDPLSMGRSLVNLINDKDEYNKLRLEAYNQSKQYTSDNSYNDFVQAIGIKLNK